MATNDLLTTKIAQGFDRLDADGDGAIDENDHVLMGRRTARALGEDENSPAEQRLIEMYLRIWRQVHLPAVPAGATALSRDSFIASTRALADDPEAARATLGAAAQTFMDVVDLDADGRISPQEYLVFMRGHCPGMAESDAATAFAHLDTDGNGYLSAEEFIRATVDYWTSSDPNCPGNWWLGPQTGITG